MHHRRIVSCLRLVRLLALFSPRIPVFSFFFFLVLCTQDSSTLWRKMLMVFFLSEMVLRGLQEDVAQQWEEAKWAMIKKKGAGVTTEGGTTYYLGGQLMTSRLRSREPTGFQAVGRSSNVYSFFPAPHTWWLNSAYIFRLAGSGSLNRLFPDTAKARLVPSRKIYVSDEGYHLADEVLTTWGGGVGYNDRHTSARENSTGTIARSGMGGDGGKAFLFTLGQSKRWWEGGWGVMILGFERVGFSYVFHLPLTFDTFLSFSPTL